MPTPEWKYYKRTMAGVNYTYKSRSMEERPLTWKKDPCAWEQSQRFMRTLGLIAAGGVEISAEDAAGNEGYPGLFFKENDPVPSTGATTTNTERTDSMAATLIEVAMIKRATAKEQEVGGRDKLIVPLTTVLADSNASAIAAVTALRAKELEGVDIGGLDIKVRTFN